MYHQHHEDDRCKDDQHRRIGEENEPKHVTEPPKVVPAQSACTLWKNRNDGYRNLRFEHAYLGNTKKYRLTAEMLPRVDRIAAFKAKPRVTAQIRATHKMTALHFRVHVLEQRNATNRQTYIGSRRSRPCPKHRKVPNCMNFLLFQHWVRANYVLVRIYPILDPTRP
jgi:hypothetical protein